MAADHLEPAAPRPSYWSAFIPLLILIITYLGWTVFQTYQLLRERDVLTNLHANQERQFQDSKKLRESLDKIARETQVLANRGNKNALLIVEELRKRGVTINPEGPTPPAASGAGGATPASPQK